MQYINKGKVWGEKVGEGDLAIINQVPFESSNFTQQTAIWMDKVGILPRLNSAHNILTEQKEKWGIKELREGWKRARAEIEVEGVKRVLVFCADSDLMKVIFPDSYINLENAHGNIFTLANTEYVFTPSKVYHHSKSWFERDVDRFLNLKKPTSPLDYLEEIPYGVCPLYVVVDLETTGLDTHSDKITTLAVQWSDNDRVLITKDIDSSLNILIKWATLGTNFIFHNSQFDLGFMPEKFRDLVFGRTHCTLIRSKAKGELNNSLKHLAVMYTNRPGNYAWYREDEDHSFDDPAYVCEDLETTWQLAKKFGVIK